MACPEQQKWLSNYSLVEFQDYHRPYFFPLEFVSIALILILAVSFNFATIFTILRVRSLREKLGSRLIINLCVMDLITSLGSMLFSLIDIFFEGYFLCMDVLCRIHGGLAVVGCFGNFAGIIVIAIHRFLVIVAEDKVTLTSKHVNLLIGVSWVFTLGLVIPPIGGNATSVYKHGTHHCSPTWSCPYFVTAFSVIYALTLPTMVACYSTIFWKVRLSRRRLVLHKEKAKKDEECSISKDNNSTTMKQENIAMKTKPDYDYAPRSCSSQPDSGAIVTVVNHYPATDDPSTELKQLRMIEVSGPSQSTTSHGRAYKMKKTVIRNQNIDTRIALAGGLLVVTTAVCWTPYFVVNSCTRARENSHALSIFAMWIAYSNSALDPLIYSIFNTELQRAILNQVHILWRFLKNNILRIN